MAWEFNVIFIELSDKDVLNLYPAAILRNENIPCSGALIMTFHRELNLLLNLKVVTIFPSNMWFLVMILGTH